MANICLKIEYDGSHFHGWQFQPNVVTIEEELLKTLRLVLRTEIRAIYASGRTDAGVHARGQVANFHVNLENVDLHRLKHAVSSIMRPKLAIVEAKFVADDFHARFNAISKQYSYRILNRDAPPVLDYGRVLYVHKNLDLIRMQSAARALEGEHDFKSFQGDGCQARDTVRKIFRSEIIKADDYLIYQVEGEGFLKHMVRNIVGTLIDVGSGKIADIEKILKAKDRREAGMTAPAHALCLDWVRY